MEINDILSKTIAFPCSRNIVSSNSLMNLFHKIFIKTFEWLKQRQKLTFACKYYTLKLINQFHLSSLRSDVHLKVFLNQGKTVD